MRKAKYHLKRRGFQPGKPNPFKRRQLKYDPWETVASFDTEEEAREYGHKRKSQGGLYDWAIFYRGERLTNPGAECRPVRLGALSRKVAR